MTMEEVSDDQLLVEVRRSEGWLYLLKLNVMNHYLNTKEDNSKNWLWHSQCGHINLSLVEGDIHEEAC